MKLLPPARIDPLRNSDRPDEAFESSWRTQVKRRVVVVLGVLFCGTLVIEGRLVQLQVFQHDDFVKRAVGQQERVLEPTGMRGEIVDRNGQLLAYSVHAKTIAFDPSKVVDPVGTAAQVCAAISECDSARQATILKVLQKKTTYVFVARQVSDQEAQRIVNLKLPGMIDPVDETRRYYPNRELAAHLLGAVSSDNQGIAGVEYAYDAMVSGKKGRVQILNDARRNQSKKTIQVRVDQEPTEGATLELTIDMYLQHIVERELAAGVEANNAKGGTAIIMDPQTGAILALASYPTFNPNSFAIFSAEERMNRATQGMYEPGSTFKVITAAAALEEGVVKPTDMIDASAGYINIGSRHIEDTANHGVLSFEDVIVESSNVGAIKIGMRVGADRLRRYVRRFGFGQALSPDFKGQTAGQVPGAAVISDSTLASLSMGYEIGVTPLQIITAVNSIANGGTLLEPHLVHAFVRNGVPEIVAPKALRQTVNAETAATLTTMLEGVTVRGTGTAAKLDGYQVAGKTGTAAKPGVGGYSKSVYNSSFVGFVPSRQPALTIFVVIDSPSAGQIYGGTVAAPVFKRIAEASLRQLSVPPTINPVPSVVVGRGSRATVSARPMGSDVEPVFIPAGGAAVMPDVRGLGMREAVRALGRVGLTVHAVGSGPVVTQTPAPGDPIESGGSCELQLQRAAADARPRAGGGS